MDVISIGGATRDIFFKTSRGRVIPDPDHPHSELLVFEHGSKIIPEEVYFTYGGGAHNSAVNFNGLGLHAGAAIAVGDDSSGTRLKKAFAETRIDTVLVRNVPHTRTALSFIVTVGRDHVSFLYRGANDHIDIEDWSAVESARWLYVTSLTGHGAELLPRIATIAKDGGVELALNPGSRQIRDGYRGLKEVLEVTAVLLVNYEEAHALASSYKPDVDEEDWRALLAALKEMGPKLVVITAGRDGSYALDDKGYRFQPAIEVETLDTTGAGDSYGSTLVASLVLGHPVDRAMAMAAVNSAAVVQHFGATEGLLSMAELERRVREYGAA